MNILGLGGSGHDWSSCLLTKDQRMVMIDEERITRMKYGIGTNLLAAESRKYCLKALNLKSGDVDCVVTCDLTPSPFYFPFREKTVIINHHLAHAHSAFCPSPFKKAALLIVDNSGSIVQGNEVETISYFKGDSNGIHLLSKVQGIHEVRDINNKKNYYNDAGHTENSLGDFYRTVSIELGFGYTSPNGSEISEDGKTMGLASYGNNELLGIFKRFITLLPDGQIHIPLSKEELVAEVKSLINKSTKNNLFQCKANIAYAAQKLLEEALLHCANYLYQITKTPNLCIAGGVGLNSVANERILRETPFTNIFVQPASGDNGIAMGAALYGFHKLKGVTYNLDKRIPLKHPYLGKSYPENYVKETVENTSGIKFTKLNDQYKQVAELISKGYIVAWFQGGAEIGPRALGNRSILADPRRAEMKDIMNEKVKHRESFRPFAPAVLEEFKSEYFDIPCNSPYMLIVSPVKEPQKIPAVTHVDNTARLQTVSSETNLKFYKLIQHFYEITDIPVLMNTSFNVAGEPIVETPEDAIKCFLGTKIDFLVIHDYLIEKDNDIICE